MYIWPIYNQYNQYNQRPSFTTTPSFSGAATSGSPAPNATNEGYRSWRRAAIRAVWAVETAWVRIFQGGTIDNPLVFVIVWQLNMAICSWFTYEKLGSSTVLVVYWRVSWMVSNGSFYVDGWFGDTLMASLNLYIINEDLLSAWSRSWPIFSWQIRNLIL